MNVARSRILKTERCLLRHVTEADIPHVFSATQHDGFNEGMVWDAPLDPSELVEAYKDNCEAWFSGRAYVFTIETHQQTFVGRISIRATDLEGLWNVGFWTHPEHQGRGYMTEALKRLLSFGFDELLAREIEGCHASWNEASKKVLTKCGMIWREHIPQGFMKHGEWIAEERLSIFQEA